MLLCFNSAWTASLHKSWTSRTNAGKSLLCGYLCGAVHKGLNDPDLVILLYLFGALMVLFDLLLFTRNAKLQQ